MTVSQLTEAFLLGVGLSMDALAVSLALGAAERKSFTWKKILLTAGLFGLFQAGMPLIGWFGGSLCGDIVRTFGKIAASLLLAFIGFRMLRPSREEDGPPKGSGLRELLALAFATSIDALLVGVSYACLGRTDILGDVLVIGVVTAFISAAGCVSGRMFGNCIGRRSPILGGLVLLGIAAKIIFFG